MGELGAAYRPRSTIREEALTTMKASSPNPMVTPAYEDVPKGDIPLHGKGLAFGAGQLLHEDAFFDFSKVGRLITYDPEVETAPGRVPGWYEHLTRLEDLKKIPDGSLDFALCLFSLHYEPQWLTAIQAVAGKLRKDGVLYFSEDGGFRAVLDNSDGIHASPDWLRDPIRAAFLERIKPHNAAPWFPDISASDYGLVQRILVGFGTLKAVKTLSLRRKIDTSQEPSCYLPWNRDRCTTLSTNCIDSLKAALASAPIVDERITLYEWRKERDIPNIWDLERHCTTAIWDSIAHRAATQISRIVVPDSSNHEQSAIDYRKAALQVLYFTLLRHFSCWRACELIIGALQDSVAPALTQYNKWTVLERYANDRFLAAKLSPPLPTWLEQYAKKLESDKLGWAGQLLYKSRQSGVYAWAGANSAITPPKACVSINANEKLAGEFQKRLVPSCLYFLDALASTHVASPQLADRLYGATVIYLEENGSQQLPALLYCIRAVRSILVGRSAFLEMQLVQDAANDYKNIQGPLSTIQKSVEELAVLSTAVETIRSALDRDYWHPGANHLAALAKVFDQVFFSKAGQHEAFQITVSGITAFLTQHRVLAAKCVEDLKQARNGPRTATASSLFSFLDESFISSNVLKSAAFAKVISRNWFPAAWILICTGELESKKSADNEFLKWLALGFQPTGKSSPMSVLIALDRLCPLTDPKADYNGGKPKVTFTIRNDGISGHSLEKLRRILLGTESCSSGRPGNFEQCSSILREAGATIEVLMCTDTLVCTVSFLSADSVRTENELSDV